MKPSERIQEIREKIAFDCFGITGKEFVPAIVFEQAKQAAKDNSQIAVEAIIQYLDEVSVMTKPLAAAKEDHGTSQKRKAQE